MFTQQQVRELLTLQRQICKQEYCSYYAQSSEDFSNEIVENAILNAPEPSLFNVSSILPKNIHDELVSGSILPHRLKTVIKQMCDDGRYFEGKVYSLLMASDLALLTEKEWSRIRNVGACTLSEMKNYLISRYIYLERK
jgi:hypothetical protein